MVVNVTLTDQQLDDLVGYATRSGYLREEPKKTWTPQEKRQAAKWALDRLVQTLTSGVQLNRPSGGD